MRLGERLLQGFEAVLWNARLLVIVAVAACLVTFLAVLGAACVDVCYLVGDLLAYPGLDEYAREAMKLTLTSSAVKVLDMFLLAVMMLIAAMGLYELFISKIELLESSELAGRLLLIRNLDDLKTRLAALVLLKLMVKLFQQALSFKYETSVDLLVLATCVLFVGLASFLAARSHGPGGH